MAAVLVCNAGGTEVLHTVTVRHAVRMLARQVARIKEAVEGETIGPYARPRALELVRYVFAHWRYKAHGGLRNPNGPANVSRAGIFARDGYQCAYCVGGVGSTIDHIFPRVRGGLTTWENCVAACRRCNRRKGRKLLAATGMVLRYKPYTPTRAEMFAMGCPP